jgi:hypothetical protein
MKAYNAFLAFIILYIPYQRHYPVVLDLKGLNIINVLFLVVMVVVLARRERTEAPTPLKGRFIFFIAMLTVSFLIGQAYDSSTFSEDLTYWKNSVFYMLFYFLFFHAVRDVKTIRFLVNMIIVVTFLVSLQAIRQAIDYGITSFTPTHRASGPFSTTYVGANIAAAYFVIFVPLAFAVAITCRSQPKMRLFAFVTGVMGLFGAFFTYSRQAYLILAFLLFLQAARRNLTLAVFVGAMVATYQLWAPDSVIERLGMTEQADVAGGDEKLDESTESRFIIWDAATYLITSRPWGIGLNHFKREIGNYAPGYSHFDAHNAFVLVTTEAGILGGIAMLVLLSGFVLLGRKTQKLDRAEDSQLLGGGFVISALGAMMANLFGSRIFDGEVMGNFWILGGLVARYYTLQMAQRDAA